MKTTGKRGFDWTRDDSARTLGDVTLRLEWQAALAGKRGCDVRLVTGVLVALSPDGGERGVIAIVNAVGFLDILVRERTLPGLDRRAARAAWAERLDDEGVKLLAKIRDGEAFPVVDFRGGQVGYFDSCGYHLMSFADEDLANPGGFVDIAGWPVWRIHLGDGFRFARGGPGFERRLASEGGAS